MKRLPIILLFVFVALFAFVRISAQSFSNDVFVKRSAEARTLMEQREYKQAVLLWSDVLKSLPNLSREQQTLVRFQRALCHLQLRADSSAIIDVTASLELIPSAEAYYLRSKLYLRQKLYPFAMADITKALDLVPDNASYYLLRGNIHFQRGSEPDGCSDIAMARVLGLAFPDDISYEPCRLLGVAVEKNILNTTEVEVSEKATNKIANTALESLIIGTNNLNTSYHRWSVQAQYGGSGVMLSRLFYDVESGNIAMANVGYSVSRLLSFWLGGFWSSMSYTQGSERLRLSPKSSPPFGSVIFAGGMVGAQYSVVAEKNIDIQFGLGIGYKWTRYPTDVPIIYTNGDIDFANMGIRYATGIFAQPSMGAEWRVLKNVALTGNLLFGISFSQYNYYTLTRRDRESIHQFLSYVGGLRFYFDEQSE